uniref:DH domain-containing protein n=1 Tax=Stomoxys calcitrans TaxID=35570 RepID=A0A1I8NY64_STOCA
MSLRSSKKLKKIQHLENLITELINTEENYIKDLSNVVECYLQEFRTPNPRVCIPGDLRGCKAQLVFANIEDIYYWHKESFYGALKKHRQSPKDLAKVFLKSESQFHIYAKYSGNKAKSHYIVTEYANYFDAVRKHFNQKLDRVLATVNDFTAIQSINNFHGDISDQGKLVYHNFLTCKYKEKKTRYYVFLFTRIIIFTKKIDPKRKYSSATYNYKLEMPMNKVSVKELHNKRFSMIYAEPNVEELILICFGEDETIHNLWLQKIHEQIRMQRELIADLVNPSTESEREVV